ncbi:SUMF1/EgtB/PvdO family nonheme iron enzyme [Polycyclovorans algicola]|uniref:SUMF1/EgtB/PvdO family nonheme iron enzyme n=1 Tax=Polycyclovorans algicola TaxID=616992 RepID=UPI0013785217|nr:SUMF1/EgtB/PvdO family nonheme iron enzyme [Polycyclovorans algicola]
MSGISVFLLLALVAGQATAAKRVALVIGNDSYQTSPKLQNARNDARAVAGALSEIGFTLSGGQAHLDVSRGDLLRLVRDFTGSLSSDDIALFYFAGHGVAGGGENWLLPVNDGEIRFQEDVPDYAVSAQSVLQRLEVRGGGINLVILDACRNNPLPDRRRSVGATRGLQRMQAPFGSFIVYAAGLGEAALDGRGSNGLFTQELLTRIRTPGLRVDDLFTQVRNAVRSASGSQQTPWSESSLPDVFYLVPGAQPPALAAAPALDPRLAEEAAFKAAQAANSVEGWQIFQRRYPNSAYAATAEIQLAALTRPRPQPQPTQPQSRPQLQTPSQAPAVAATGWAAKDCPDCPEMVKIPGRNYSMGKFEVTFDEWDACHAAGGCSKRPDDEGWGRGRRPVINVSWEQVTQQYIPWLNHKTGKTYRLPTEEEWEHAARAGTTTEYWWGNDIGRNRANCLTCGSQWDSLGVAPVGSFAANPWGLHDVHGNVREWTQGCSERHCGRRVIRAGSWSDLPADLRAASRRESTPRAATMGLGFRLARTD